MNFENTCCIHHHIAYVESANVQGRPIPVWDFPELRYRVYALDRI